MNFDKEYWNQKYINEKTGWDIGYVSTPLKEYIDQLENKELKILIPGCGNAYEAEYLVSKGFKNVYLIDWSEIALDNFKKRAHEIPDSHLFCGDFFKHIEKYDMILEQTFFCSLDPSERANYAKKMHELLNDNGKLVGLLFDTSLNDDVPPFGGSREEYVKYFGPYFDFKTYETAYNSIKPRAGREIFMILVKKPV
ncbi:MAG: methyltransferase domain-containing protein [Ignavibacteriae bacterium]|nr:MAG: methyltransferase domain-containing protein [Ignavibacteriota bacterium]